MGLHPDVQQLLLQRREASPPDQRVDTSLRDKWYGRSERSCGEELSFTAEEWKAKSDKEKQEILLNYRIAYRGETMVNWCAALGTVLANDES